MTRTLAGKLLVPGLVLLLAVACTQDPAAQSFEPECTVNQFRACESEECRGVQQCVEPGLYTACACVVLDASYALDSQTPDAAPADATSEADAGGEQTPPGDAAGQ